ncbi:MAG: hypothetical protein ACXAAK_15425, partial [Candidatus Thorarchaeota archaeon]
MSRSRSLRWFGTRVPLLSRGVLSLIAPCVALPLSGIIYVLWGSLLFTAFWFYPLALILPLGTVSYFVYLMNLQMRYKNQPTNSEFIDMSGRVHQKILVSSRARVWVRESTEPFIVSSYNPVFDAVIVSEPMVDLMLARPEAGEVLLAYHLARIPRARWFGDFIGTLFLISIFTYLSAVFLVTIIIQVLAMVTMMGILALVSLYIVIPILPALVIKGAFWKHEPAFTLIHGVYNLHPQVAKVEVERGTPLDDEEMEAVVWGVREWERKKRGDRRWGISTIAILLSWIILVVVSFWLSGLSYYFLLYLTSPIPFIGAIL